MIEPGTLMLRTNGGYSLGAIALYNGVCATKQKYLDHEVVMLNDEAYFINDDSRMVNLYIDEVVIVVANVPSAVSNIDRIHFVVSTKTMGWYEHAPNRDFKGKWQILETP